MAITNKRNIRPLTEAKFTGRKFTPRTVASLCDCLIVDPCGCYVNPCACFRTDTGGCYRDCPCEGSSPSPVE